MKVSNTKLTRGYKNNESVLKLLEHLYLYGAFSKEGVTRLMEVEEKTSELYLLNLIYNFGEDHILQFFSGNRKYYYAGFNYYRDLYNYLMKAYYLKTTTQGRIQGYFHILYALNAKSDQTAKDLLDFLAQDGFEYNDSFIRDLANDMVNHGILKIKVEANRHHYGLTEDSLKLLSDQEVYDLYRALYYFSNTTYPFAVGDMARRNVAMYLQNYRKLALCPKETLHVINKGFHLTLYEDLVVDQLLSFKDRVPLVVKVDQGQEVLFYPNRFEMDYEAPELMILGQLESGTHGKIHIYQLLHGEIPDFIPNLGVTKEDVVLQLDVQFRDEEFIIHRLLAEYPKAQTLIRNDSIGLDLSAYPRTQQVEIILQELPHLKALEGPQDLKDHLRALLKGGLEAHDDE